MAPALRAIAAAGMAGLAVVSCPRSGPIPGARDATHPADIAIGPLIERLSEPGGHFDTDNLISNESAYLQVADRLEHEAPHGGVYIGVGPEQNYSYLARVRPTWAFILDIRRDNAIQHLLLNAILAEADTPEAYLCRLLSRPCRGRLAPERNMEAVLDAVSAVPPSERELESTLTRAALHARTRLGFALTESDQRFMRRVLRAFLDQQLELRFESHWQGRRFWHPSYGSLLRARSPSGRFGNFLASDADYRVVRDLARAGRLVPVVGNFAGAQALRSIGAFARERGLTLSAFYVSNVEFYLYRQAELEDYVVNLRTLPITPESVFIRAYFQYERPHPEALPGHRSATVLQRVQRLLDQHAGNAYRSYWDIAFDTDR